jgi:hypothetical protein
LGQVASKISEIRNFFANGAGHDFAEPRWHDYIAFASYRRQAAPCTRTKHLITCRSQDDMHLLLLAPPPGLAHLPTQFAA